MFERFCAIGSFPSTVLSEHKMAVLVEMRMIPKCPITGPLFGVDVQKFQDVSNPVVLGTIFRTGPVVTLVDMRQSVTVLVPLSV